MKTMNARDKEDQARRDRDTMKIRRADNGGYVVNHGSTMKTFLNITDVCVEIVYIFSKSG